MIVLEVIGYVILALICIILLIFAVVLALSCFKIQLLVEFYNKIQFVELKFLMFKFVLVDEKNKKDKTKKVKEDIKKTDEIEVKIKEDIPKFDPKDLLKFKNIVGKVSKSVRKLLKKIYVNDIEIDMSVSKEDPFETGMYYGKVNAFVYSFMSFLNNAFNLQYKSVKIYPNFEKVENNLMVNCNLTFRPIFGIIILSNLTFHLGVDYLKSTIKARQNKKINIKKKRK